MATIYSLTGGKRVSTNNKMNDQVSHEGTLTRDGASNTSPEANRASAVQHRRRRPRTFGDVDHYKGGAGSISDFGGSFKGSF